ncbi:MAG: T9SS type A sorting domain-containing protein [Bacteroidia bacterium]|nr:T9SS type A sorting domain-containing protein [Bacteroidia bacterium]
MKIKTTLFVIMLFHVINFTVTAQWNTNSALNTSVSATINDQQDPRVITDNKSGAIITWTDYRNNILSGDIYAQRMNSQGVNKWIFNGVPVCNDINNQVTPIIIEDGFGGAVIVWQDSRNANKDIFAQRIDSTGAIQWASNGVGVVIKSLEQQNPKIINDGSNGFIIVWQDSVIGSWDIYAQKINSNGVAQWASGGVAVCAATGNQVNPKIETDNQAGAIITWQDKRNGADYDIYAQRINSSGVSQWTSNGISICSITGTQSNPKIAPDGSGGVFIVWQDKRNGADYDIYAQRINSIGVVQWIVNGVAVCSAAGNQSAIDFTTDNTTGAIITWKDFRSGEYDIYAQLINLNGVSQWAANGVAVSTALLNQINPNIIGDGLGGAIIVWEDYRTGSTISDIYSQRITAAGTTLWTSNGVATGIATGNQTGPKNISDGNGGAIFVWQDKRGIDNDVYAHHFDLNGLAFISTEDMFSKDVNIHIFPNPITTASTIVINFQENINYSDIRMSIYNIDGMRVQKTFSLHSLKSNENKIEISLANDMLPAGMYFYQFSLVSNNITKTYSGKFIIINSTK